MRRQKPAPVLLPASAPPRLALLPALALLVAALAAPDRALADNIDPNGDGSRYAWGENVGWLNARPLVPGLPGMQVDDFGLSGWMWSENLGWVSLSCANTGTCATVDYKVANDGFGRLSGYAWSENAGWINFSPALGGVGINPSTGAFAGSAWGENIGWISFSSAGPVAHTIQTSWCQTTAAPPPGMPALQSDAAPSGTQLSWTAPAAAAWYEVVSGDLATLRNTGGNFTAATQACVAENLTTTSTTAPGSPALGQGIWFLVRPANCKGDGTYDEGGSQIGARDAEIDGSAASCP
jgi:hypothetical protein